VQNKIFHEPKQIIKKANTDNKGRGNQAKLFDEAGN